MQRPIRTTAPAAPPARRMHAPDRPARADRPVRRSRRARLLPVAALVAALAAGSAAAPRPAAAAATIHVTIFTDTVAADGKCSLREALINANNDAATHATCAAGSNADTIVFDTSVPVKIDLAAPLPVLNDPAGVSIMGAGLVRIDGKGSHRILETAGGAQLNLGGMTLQNGNAGAGSGGAILAQGSVSITQSTLVSNKAMTGSGGAVAVVGSNDLTINKVTFGGNQALQGGAIAIATGDASILLGAFNGNSAGQAGAIAFGTGSSTLTSSKLTGNQTTTNGSGAIAVAGTVTMGDTTVTTSTGRALAVLGGGTVLLTKGVFSANSGSDGGAILNLGEIRMARTIFGGNTATGDGGAINSSGTLIVIESTLTRNTAAGDGGAIANAGTVEVINSTMHGNTATGHGGGLITSRNASLRSTTVAGNSGTAGGDGLTIDNSQASITNTIVADGTAGKDCELTGGASLVADHSLIEASGADACTVTNGVAGNIVGADPLLGILLGTPGRLSIKPDSPARDAGDDPACAAGFANNRSQNGVTRPIGPHCDIGSYELDVRLSTFGSRPAEDGTVTERTQTSSTGGTATDSSAKIFVGDTASNQQQRGILSFRTAQLPDNALIGGVEVWLRDGGQIGNPLTRFGGFRLDVRRGTFGRAALQKSDFQAATTRTAGPIAAVPAAGGWLVLNLDSVGSAINRLANDGGLTQVRVRFQRGDNKDGVAQYLKFYSGNGPAVSRPHLKVTWYLP